MWFSSNINVLELVLSIHFVKSFIQTIRLLVVIIQKIHWCSTFIQTFHPFFTFIHVHVEKYFPRHSYVTHRDFLRICCPCHQNIPNIFIPTHRFIFMLTCSPPSVVDCNCIHLLKICIVQNPTFTLYNAICSMVQIVFPLGWSPNVSDDF
jgi:hypothetical protein